MRLCIVIPVFNRKEVTLRCLKQLHEQALNGMEIVVVDDGSKDGTADAIALSYPDVHIVNGTGYWWYTRSVNEGLKYADQNLDCSDYLLLNDDVLLPSDYLTKVSASLSASSRELVVHGSVSFDSQNQTKPTFLGVKKLAHWRNKQFHYNYNDYLFAKQKWISSWESIFIPGRGMFFSKKTLHANGYLDEAFPQYGSDYEFSARATKYGMKARVHLDAVLYSHESLTGSGSPKNKPSFKNFWKSLFNKYSPTYPLNDYKLIERFGNRFLLPLSFSFIVLGKFKAYLKYR